MKSYPNPKPASLSDDLIRKYAYDHQVNAWVSRLNAGIPIDEPPSEEQRPFVCSEVEKRRIEDGRDRLHIERAVAATTPLVSLPKLDKPRSDLELLFSLPEMQEWWGYVEHLRASAMGSQ